MSQAIIELENNISELENQEGWNLHKDSVLESISGIKSAIDPLYKLIHHPENVSLADLLISLRNEDEIEPVLMKKRMLDDPYTIQALSAAALSKHPHHDECIPPIQDEITDTLFDILLTGNDNSK